MAKVVHDHPMLDWLDRDAIPFLSGVSRLYGGKGYVYGPVKKAGSAVSRIQRSAEELRRLADLAEANGLARPIDDQELNRLVDADMQIFQCIRESAESTLWARERHRFACKTMRAKVRAADDVLSAILAVRSAADEIFQILEDAHAQSLAIADKATSIGVTEAQPDTVRAETADEPDPFIGWVEGDIRVFLRTAAKVYGKGSPLQVCEGLQSEADRTRELAAGARSLAERTKAMHLDRVVPGIEAADAVLARGATQFADADFHMYRTVQEIAYDVKASRNKLRDINLALRSDIALAQKNRDVAALIVKVRDAVIRTIDVIVASMEVSAAAERKLEEITYQYRGAAEN